MGVRHFILVTHRWLGLTSSIVLAIVGATGAVLTWREHLALAEALGRYASPLHERLAAGRIGYWIVVVSTGLAVLLEIGGLVLWWKRRTWRIRFDQGLWRGCFDLHHMAGVVLLPLMLVLAATGFAMAFVLPAGDPELRRLLARFHIGHFPVPIKMLYTIATLGFVVQGATGLVIWWTPKTVAAFRERATKVLG
jgi:uncharacterized iron-regulated membrane protein